MVVVGLVKKRVVCVVIVGYSFAIESGGFVPVFSVVRVVLAGGIVLVLFATRNLDRAARLCSARPNR